MTPVETLLSGADRGKWQPIAEAPKDGTNHITYNDATGEIDYLCYLTKEKSRKTGREGWHEVYTLGCDFSATHFKNMDIPDTDIVAKLSAALRVAVDYIGCSEEVVPEALAKINAICEGKL